MPGIQSLPTWDKIKRHNNKTQAGASESQTITLASNHYRYDLHFQQPFRFTSLKKKKKKNHLSAKIVSGRTRSGKSK